MNILIALAPALCFGIIPFIATKARGHPIQQQLGTAIGALVFAVVEYVVVRPRLTDAIVLGSVLSGLLWSVGMLLQYDSYTHLGASKGFALSVGAQLVFNAIVGVLVFDEWSGSAQLVLGCVAMVLIVAGVACIAYRDGKDVGEDAARERSRLVRGLVVTFVSSIALVAYADVPRAFDIGPLEALLPQACGIAVGSTALAALAQRSAASGDKSDGWPLGPAILRNAPSGLIWATGNVTMLASNSLNGVAVGFTLSQMGILVSTASGLFVLHEERTRRELRMTLVGNALVMVGAVLVGLTKA